MFFSKRFIISDLAFNSFIYFKFIFVHNVNSPFESFAHNSPVFPVPSIKETFFSPLYHRLIDHKSVGSFLHSVPLVFVSVVCVCVCVHTHAPESHCFDYYSYTVQFKTREDVISSFVLVSQDFLAIQSFMFSYKFCNHLFQFCDKCH